ncbi:diguanylate cyclase [Psychrosphaera sp. F3M07]|uniref:sensor domain-containing diguanylate cyclase n=1 Tax=Psychrosphaera sp. F3M07 TaxID=2841560 RepID=UPI001C08FD45|nr:sensor domain-containing diguanylate cyclase [Psychrosphaera sp. F3M07]MBU2917157.1 diguanylate cyclase [Psychrosphaera sp. F3M07]
MINSLSQELQYILIQALNKTDDSIAIFDQYDEIAYCNLSFANLFGFETVDMIVGKSFSQIISNSYYNKTGVNIETNDIEAWLHTANMKRRSTSHRSFEIDTKDGSWFLITEQLVDEYLFLYATNITASKIQQFELLKTQKQLASLAATDSLTGIYNRRHFYLVANNELIRCQRKNLSASIMILDIDHFKLVNDNYGHSCGDNVLKSFTDRINKELRSYDIFARIGGEEFAVLLPDANKENALDIAERCRKAISDSPFIIDGVNVAVTTSIGMCTYESDVDDLEQIMKLADKNLYIAKVSGRNKICS